MFDTMNLRRKAARGLTATLAGLLVAGSLGFAAVAQEGAAEQPNPDRQTWTFAGPFGYFDRAQLQRGFQVYKEVCSTCHSLSIPFRTLAQPGGPEYSEGQVKALAASYKIKDGPDDKGEMFERPGRPSDLFPPPFPNEQAAAAALGKAPPDMALLAKARKYERGFPLFLIDPLIQYQELGVDYIYGILTGYTHADDGNWDEYYPGHKIAMPKPLSDGAVEYTDGAPKTVQQYAKDVSAFLMWAAEPTMEQRKKIGFRVMVFLIVFAGLLYFTKKRIWARAHADEAATSH